MLKSTHKPVALKKPDPLPAPWTEHKTPDGIPYYYNTETQRSTYKRPGVGPHPRNSPEEHEESFRKPQVFSVPPSSNTNPGTEAGSLNTQILQRANYFPHDRPKSKHVIPGHRPWLLVKTKLRRRFVHNPATKESLWKIPDELRSAIDLIENTQEPQISAATVPTQHPLDTTNNVGNEEGDEHEEYEEIEVTDSEYESEGHPPKRQKTQVTKTIVEESPNVPDVAEHVHEFGEDDMVTQLAAMGHDYDLDPTEYYGGDVPEEEYGLTAEEAAASFREMLDDHGVNPFSTWDNIIEDSGSALINDDRYTILPNKKTRREEFAKWSSQRAAELKAQRETQAILDPRIPYLRFLSNHATPKLYWAEFRLKWKREPEMKESKLGDREREKMYREYISRVTKMTATSLEDDLMKALRELSPGPLWNQSVTIQGVLPDALLADMRFATVQLATRDAIVTGFIRSLPKPEDLANVAETEDERARREERQRRDDAVRKRSEAVYLARQTQQRNLRQGQQLLRVEEAELDRASRVNRVGLRDSLA